MSNSKNCGAWFLKQIVRIFGLKEISIFNNHFQDALSIIAKIIHMLLEWISAARDPHPQKIPPDSVLKLKCSFVFLSSRSAEINILAEPSIHEWFTYVPSLLVDEDLWRLLVVFVFLAAFLILICFVCLPCFQLVCFWWCITPGDGPQTWLPFSLSCLCCLCFVLVCFLTSLNTWFIHFIQRKKKSID